ncbi:MAG TPA: 4'-phosphopantetheinyl transferase superfamily protein [Nitrosospira sp.]
MELSPGVVHLWYISVADKKIPFDYHLSLLDEEERCRASRFRFDRDRVRFVLGRGSLRCLLARYTDSSPADIQFKQNRYGKLYLQYPASSIRFNITHSEGCIIHALAQEAEVGVDIEAIRDAAGVSSISSHFAPGEQAWLLGADFQERDNVFFTFWVCKEAYIKALGRGLSKPLNSFEISLAKRTKGMELGMEGVEGMEAKILSDSDDKTAQASWRLLLFEPNRNVLGCLAANATCKVAELLEYSSGRLLRRMALM